MTRFRLVLISGVVVSIAVAAGSGALAPSAVAGKRPARSRKLKYKVTFEIAHGSYGSTQTTSLGSASESDNFKAAAHYTMEIPKKGSVPAVKRASSHEEFEAVGGGPQWQTTGGRGNCTGNLYSDPTLPPLLKGGEHGGQLAFRVDMAKNVLVENVRGQWDADHTCQEILGDGIQAFYPAWLNYEPGMLTADLRPVSVKALRGLKVGGKTLAVSATATDDAVKHPPPDCSTPDVICTQQLGWRGKVTFERVS
jgi:hypothetical protein